ncbi:hypothetical protein [Dactylosporangium cerinum]|uniref:hypothetical protein n=1 Tax=Dactylosporangium cerinum TaxID=1434730 RepID=UPI0036D34DC3
MGSISSLIAVAAGAPVIASIALTAWKAWLSRRETVSIIVSVGDTRIEVSSNSRLKVGELLSVIEKIQKIDQTSNVIASDAESVQVSSSRTSEVADE